MTSLSMSFFEKVEMRCQENVSLFMHVTSSLTPFLRRKTKKTLHTNDLLFSVVARAVLAVRL